jgi:branched-chain amino acid transport system permease protein
MKTLKGIEETLRSSHIYAKVRNQRLWYLILALGALLFPLFTNNYWISVAVFFFIYALLGLSLNIIVGYAGLFQLGHAAFWAVGAYTTAILNTRCGVPILLTLPISALISALFAIIISKPILHLRGDYLCLVTIGFGEIVRLFLFNDPLGITGGINGIRNIDRPSILGFAFRRPIHYYYLTLTFVALTVFIMRRLENSRLGRAWVYVREDELAAEAMGIDTTYVKLLAFTIGASLAGVAGTLYACRYTVIAPETFSFWNSVIMFCIVVLGGTGSIPGVFVGTVGMVVLPELLRDALEKILQWRMLVFGAAMVLMMIFRPEGLWPSPVRHHELHAVESRSSELKR